MPATLTRPHPTPLLSSTRPLSVSDLHGGERAVALYASDMPADYRFRKDDADQVLSWILQGAARMGLDELRRSAAFLYGYRLLWLADMVSSEQRRAHKLRFPDARRLDRAEMLAALSIGFPSARVTPEAIKRGEQPQVEGICWCAGTGWVPFDMGDGTEALQACPGHNPDGRLPVTSGAPA
jgi:hypothetical protein